MKQKKKPLPLLKTDKNQSESERKLSCTWYRPHPEEFDLVQNTFGPVECLSILEVGRKARFGIITHSSYLSRLLFLLVIDIHIYTRFYFLNNVLDQIRSWKGYVETT